MSDRMASGGTRSSRLEDVLSKAPCNPGSDSVSSPKTRLFPGRGASVRWGRSLNRIELSRLRSTSCYMASAGTTYAHTARRLVGYLGRIVRLSVLQWRSAEPEI